MEGVDGMMWLGWVAAVVLAVVVVVLLQRKPPAGQRPSNDFAGGESAVGPDPGLAEARGRSAQVDTGTADPRGSERDALSGTLGYLRRAVIPDLEELRSHLATSPAGGLDLLEQALDALEDLAFYAEPPPPEPLENADLAQVVQEAVRQYTIETRVPVRVHAPAEAIQAAVHRERLKDAVFMLLANAGQYSEGRPIDVYMEKETGRGFRIRIVDAGPGFSEEAMERAFEPFWSTDTRGVGLGLPQARARILEMKGRLSLRNQDEGGAEVVVDFPSLDEEPAA
ncbi:hypothetical protein BH23GEM11_BH23GEM11_00280 [soil metagenome]